MRTSACVITALMGLAYSQATVSAPAPKIGEQVRILVDEIKNEVHGWISGAKKTEDLYKNAWDQTVQNVKVTGARVAVDNKE
jgi:hypothetical protein